jgi:hypothetical protein
MGFPAKIRILERSWCNHRQLACAGGPGHLGFAESETRNYVFEDIWRTVYIRHASDNVIVNNSVEPWEVTGQPDRPTSRIR